MALTLAEARARFANLNPRPIDLGLARMAAALDRLGHPERALRGLIHIAGTNGKGGAVAALEAAARAANWRVQSYTSPFLWDFTENIRLNGAPIDDQACARLFNHVWHACQDIPLTWFEADTLVALLQFAQWDAGLSLIECGMGGASDATAVVPTPVAAILTNVGGDHAEFLGADLAKVADEKAGIAKGAPLYVPADFAFAVGPVRRVAVGREHPSLALANAVLAAHFPGLAPLAAMPAQLGRWMPDPVQPGLIYDVGHNAHAAQFLARRLAAFPPPYRLGLGMLRRKDPKAFLGAFVGLPLFVDPLDLGAEGYDPDHLAAISRSLGFDLYTGQDVGCHLITGSHQSVATTLSPAKRSLLAEQGFPISRAAARISDQTLNPR